MIIVMKYLFITWGEKNKNNSFKLKEQKKRRISFGFILDLISENIRLHVIIVDKRVIMTDEAQRVNVKLLCKWKHVWSHAGEKLRARCALRVRTATDTATLKLSARFISALFSDYEAEIVAVYHPLRPRTGIQVTLWALNRTETASFFFLFFFWRIAMEPQLER